MAQGVKVNPIVERWIVKDYKDGVLLKVIAERYKVCHKTIHHVRWRYGVPCRIRYTRKQRCPDPVIPKVTVAPSGM